MADNQTKSMGGVLKSFAAKFSRAQSEGTLDEVNVSSKLQGVQNSVEEYEARRIDAIKKQFDDFMNPVTQEIEADEANLIKAYDLYCKLLEACDSVGDSGTALKDFSLTSPLCKRVEYTTGDRFLYLRLWFLQVTPDAKFVPEITAVQGGAVPSYVLTFIDKDMWQPGLSEKEILQVIKE